jgi:hypothetical protein
MAEQRKSKESFAVETQKERWLKYGANVILTVLIAILLGAFLVYIGQRHSIRKDTTYEGVYSLKPQTVRLLNTLPQKVKIVGLFTRAKQQQERRDVVDDTNEVRYQQVSDLLQEYQQKSGGKIMVDMIDPVTENGKLDQLFEEVAKKYSNDTAQYDEVVKGYRPVLDAVRGLAAAETEALKKLPQATEQKLARLLDDAARTLERFPRMLDQIDTDAKEELRNKVPDRKRIVDNVRGSLEGVNKLMDKLAERYKQAAAEKDTPEAIKKYFNEAQPRLEAMKKPSADLLKKAENLGSIKQLDELRENRNNNSIAVMAETDLKVLPLSSIYQVDAPRYMETDPSKIKARFAGEQQVSTALVALTSKEKRKVCFVRSGGDPLTSIPMLGYRGQLATVADRLKEYNIEVLEKDLSGRWAMQAMQSQMRGGPPLPPDATDEQIKDAVWIVAVAPQNPQEMMTNPTAGAGPKIAEHLKNGGSAMLMLYPQTERMDFLKDWGIETKPEHLIVHDKIEATGARSQDRTVEWQRQQFVFGLNQYGDHLIAKPINSLDGFFAPIIPVNTVDAKGVKTSRLLPMPDSIPVWAEGDFDAIRNRKTVKFGQNKEGTPADLPAPLWGGATAENDKGQRLVVIGSMDFAFDFLIQEPDIDILNTQGRLVPRYPANAELFVNAVHWLTKMDTMIAISPTALQVPRVAALSRPTVNLWRGVMIAGLPLLVLVGGTFVYLKRRD